MSGYMAQLLAQSLGSAAAVWLLLAVPHTTVAMLMAFPSFLATAGESCAALFIRDAVWPVWGVARWLNPGAV